MASFTAGLVIRLALKRFSMSSSLVLPEQRHAMLIDGPLNARTRVRRECSVNNSSLLLLTKTWYYLSRC